MNTPVTKSTFLGLLSTPKAVQMFESIDSSEDDLMVIS